MMQIRSRVRAALLALACVTGIVAPVHAGTLLPPGEQTFFDSNGQVLASGCVFFYVPGTTSPKATYQNSAQTIANTNPVQLDAAGRAIIYGTGTYRQVVTKAGTNPSLPCSPPGDQIWDQLTADTSSSTTIYAGASSGTPNAITVNAPAFSGTDGQVINYISTNTNTGGATLNPSGFGAVQIVRDSATGPGALTGGELVATNAVSVIYDASAGVFHILSPITWPNAAGVPVGTVIPVGGFTAPTNYAFAYGQAISRTTFSSLLSAYTSSQSASLSSGSPTITGLSDTSQFAFGQFIESVGIPAGTTIQSCTSTTCTLSANATTTRTGTVTVFAYGNGDGSTTFNLPDYRGQSLIGRDNMGGSSANIMQVSTPLSTTSGSSTAIAGSATKLAAGMSVIGNPNVPAGTTISIINGTTVILSNNATATQSNVITRFSPITDPQGLGIAGGTFAKSLVVQEMPTHNHNITDPGHSHSFVAVQNSGSGLVSGGTGSPINPATSSTSPATTGITINNAGGGQAFQMIGPMRTVNWAVRLTP